MASGKCKTCFCLEKKSGCWQIRAVGYVMGGKSAEKRRRLFLSFPPFSHLVSNNNNDAGAANVDGKEKKGYWHIIDRSDRSTGFFPINNNNIVIRSAVRKERLQRGVDGRRLIEIPSWHSEPGVRLHTHNVHNFGGSCCWKPDALMTPQPPKKKCRRK